MKVDVINATISDTGNKGEEARFSVWDFGGQHVYYTSHQTFLSARAIYLLIMDISKPFDHVLETYDGPILWKDSGAPRTVIGKTREK